MGIEELDISEIVSNNPQLRRSIMWLIENGFNLLDANDGQDEEEDGIGPYITLTTTEADLVKDTRRLSSLLSAKGLKVIAPSMEDEHSDDVITVQGIFAPINVQAPALILVTGLTDRVLSVRQLN